MSFFGLFGKKRVPPTQEDRDLGGAVNAERLKLRKERLQVEHEIEMLRLEEQKLRIETRLDQLYGVAEEDPTDPDTIFKNLIMTAIQRGQITPNGSAPMIAGQRYIGMPFSDQGSAAAQETIISSPSIKQNLSDVQLQEIWDRIPVTQKPLIKMASDDMIRSWIMKNYPQVDDDTVDRAIKLARSR